MNHQHIIEQILGPYRSPGHGYPRPLPQALQGWYCYTVDGGHSILCALSSHYSKDSSPENFLVPVPVKSVLRVGYTVRDDYIVVDLPYDSQVGLRVPAEDEEY